MHTPLRRPRKSQGPPARHGLRPVRLRQRCNENLEQSGCIRDWILTQYPTIDAAGLDHLFAVGDIVDSSVTAIPADAPATCVRRGVWMYRPIADEPDEPIEIPIIQRTNRWIIADKPHGLSTMPRGQYIARTVTVALRRQESNDDIVTAHRLDRSTAGLLLATLHPDVRHVYQQLFAQRQVTKRYRFIAPLWRKQSVNPLVGFEEDGSWLRVSACIDKQPGTLRAVLTKGAPNSLTLLRDIGPHRVVRGLEVTTYDVELITGRTHQIRIHAAALGIPIIGDSLFGGAFAPVHGEPATENLSDLQLLAYGLEFTDPVSKELVAARSQQTLEWDAPLPPSGDA